MEFRNNIYNNHNITTSGNTKTTTTDASLKYVGTDQTTTSNASTTPVPDKALNSDDINWSTIDAMPLGPNDHHEFYANSLKPDIESIHLA